MKDKYYTPDISEFHIGFEYEEFCSQPIDSNGEWWSDPEWVKKVIMDYGQARHDWDHIHTEDFNYIPMTGRYYNDGKPKEDWTLEDKVRVKYLDKEDIESLGFTYVDYNWDFARQHVGGSLNYIMSIGNEYYFLRTWSDGVIRISKHNVKEVENSYRLFEGIIKNKSELKKLLKQIGIENEK